VDDEEWALQLGSRAFSANEVPVALSSDYAAGRWLCDDYEGERYVVIRCRHETAFAADVSHGAHLNLVGVAVGRALYPLSTRYRRRVCPWKLASLSALGASDNRESGWTDVGTDREAPVTVRGLCLRRASAYASTVSRNDRREAPWWITAIAHRRDQGIRDNRRRGMHGVSSACTTRIEDACSSGVARV
jgi:hypothetical protein